MSFASYLTVFVKECQVCWRKVWCRTIFVTRNENICKYANGYNHISFTLFVKKIIFPFICKTKNGKVQMAIGLETLPIISICSSSNPFIRLKYDCGDGCEVSTYSVQKRNIKYRNRTFSRILFTSAIEFSQMMKTFSCRPKSRDQREREGVRDRRKKRVRVREMQQQKQH